MSVVFPCDTFDVNKISLANPNGLQGGAYFSKILYNDEPNVLVQTPKSLNKNGIITTDKKSYTDLIFTQDQSHFIQWIETLEKRIQHIIYEKRHIWFNDELNLDDIEYLFTSSIRKYKSNLSLLRCHIQKNKYLKPQEQLRIYDDKENNLNMESVAKDNKVITILELAGLRFTSNSFRIDIYLKQMMVFDNTPIYEKCLINLGSSLSSSTKTLEKPKDLEILNKASSISLSQRKENVEENEQDTCNNIQDELYLEKPEQDNLQNINDVSKDLNEKLKMQHEEENIKQHDNEDIRQRENEAINDDVAINDNKANEANKDNENNDDENEDNENDDDDSEDNIENSLYPFQKDLEMMEEVDLSIDSDNLETISLKNPKEVYYEIYYASLKKAKEARNYAIKAFLEAKKIKNTYLLDEIDSSDDEEYDPESILEQSHQ